MDKTPSSSSWTLESLRPERCRGGPAPWKQETPAPLPPFQEGCPPLLMGGGVFGSKVYNDDEHLSSQEPYRVIRLGLQYGLNAIDTSPYYYPSEIILGQVLHTLAPEFPRESYYLISKVGRYGPSKADFDYSPEKVEESVMTSLKRLGTTYLDVAMMHDVEFVCDHVGDMARGGFSAREGLDGDAMQFDDAMEDIESRKISKDDLKVVKAIEKLYELKKRGLVRNVGISGYPLPVMLRLNRLVASNAKTDCIDVILSYSNHTLHCDLLTGYRERRFSAKPRGSHANWFAPKIINASPFSMGLLTEKGPPPWHPASQELRQACSEIADELKKSGASLTDTASRYGIRGGEIRERSNQRAILSTIVGLSNVEEVHQLVHSYRVLLAGVHAGYNRPTSTEPLCIMSPNAKDKLLQQFMQQQKNEEFVIKYLKDRNLFNYCWPSPPPGA